MRVLGCSTMVAALIAAVLSAVAEASGALGSAGGLPPWWLLHGVRPEGPKKDMGTYEVVTFSREQQDRFGVAEDGSVTDQTKFDEAMHALRRGSLGPGSFMVVSQEEPTAAGGLKFRQAAPDLTELKEGTTASSVSAISV
mmetsp:Transcript_3715/g.10233  ORF Transcript_3715/g.10233 Transcript_3715/m.10233 type:complete len:140 (-) Transcript_3715:140-559(-)